MTHKTDREEPRSTSLDRRTFLASMGAFLLAVHPEPIFGDGPTVPADGSPLIRALRLVSAAPLAAMRTFYEGLLGLRVVGERKGDEAEELTIAAGATRITFVAAGEWDDEPWYHFAFNIPESKLLAARAWQLERTPLIESPVHRRDPAYPDDVRHFPRWNAHSVFFWDPAGNLLEHIARHDLNDGLREGRRDGEPFTTDDILYVSEIGLVFDDQNGAAQAVHRELDLPAYPPGRPREEWWSMGDERGLVLCLPKRLWGENTDRPRRFGVHRTRATIRGNGDRIYRPAGFPYEIEVVSDES